MRLVVSLGSETASIDCLNDRGQALPGEGERIRMRIAPEALIVAPCGDAAQVSYARSEDLAGE